MKENGQKFLKTIENPFCQFKHAKSFVSSYITMDEKLTMKGISRMYTLIDEATLEELIDSFMMISRNLKPEYALLLKHLYYRILKKSG